jgi:hypothetical protein
MWIRCVCVPTEGRVRATKSACQGQGRHPVGLGADRLLDAVPLADSWDEQRVKLGFATRVTHPTEWAHGRNANGAKTQEQCSR